MNPCVKDGYVYFYLTGRIRFRLRLDDVLIPRVHSSQRWFALDAATKRSFDAAWALNAREWQLYFTRNQYCGMDYIRLTDEVGYRSVDVTLISEYGEITFYSMHPGLLNDTREMVLCFCRVLMLAIQPDRIVTALNYNLESFL